MRAFRTILLVAACAATATATNAKGKAYLEANAKKPGVITLPSGLQYKVLRAGDGEFHPTADSTCSCHYAGTLIDGTEFDSSYGRGSPTDFAPNQVIKGWTEAMQLMVEGDKWEMYIPSELGYGERGSPPKIGGGDALVFTMEILEIKGGKVPANRCDPAGDLEKCSDKEKKFIEKASNAWDEDKRAAQLKRLKGMQGGKMKPALAKWINQRIAILTKLKDAGKEEL